MRQDPRQALPAGVRARSSEGLMTVLVGVDAHWFNLWSVPCRLMFLLASIVRWYMILHAHH